MDKTTKVWNLENAKEKSISISQLDKAIEDFSAAIKLSPHWANAYYRRGRCYQRQGNLDRAAAEFKQALSLAPNDSRATLHLQQCLSPGTRLNTR